jgi:hypothetical protein
MARIVKLRAAAALRRQRYVISFSFPGPIVGNFEVSIDSQPADARLPLRRASSALAASAARLRTSK